MRALNTSQMDVIFGRVSNYWCNIYIGVSDYRILTLCLHYVICLPFLTSKSRTTFFTSFRRLSNCHISGDFRTALSVSYDNDVGQLWNCHISGDFRTDIFRATFALSKDLHDKSQLMCQRSVSSIESNVESNVVMRWKAMSCSTLHETLHVCLWLCQVHTPYSGSIMLHMYYTYSCRFQ